MVVSNPAHVESLGYALRRGVFSVVDTSPNYNDGASELLVGKVLSEGNRDAVEVVSKFGYIQGHTLARHEKKPFPEAVKYTDDCSHCVHKDFMRDQLGESLARLGVEMIDTYLVHNPEHFLMSHIPPESTRESGANELIDMLQDELLENLEECFVSLEEEIANGRIGGYGISSNSFALPKSHQHFVPYKTLLSRAANAAERVHGGERGHSFTTVQFPANVLERTALMTNGGNGFAQYAFQNGLRTMVNRALTAFDGDGSWRLAESDFPRKYAASRDKLVRHLSPEQPTEAELKLMSEDLHENWEETMEACNWLKQLIRDLDAQMGSFTSVMHYQEDLMRKIVPMINAKLDGIDDDTSDMIFRFFSEYEKGVRSVTGEQAKTHVLENIEKDMFIGEEVEKNSEMFVPTKPGKESLQEFALGWLLDQPSVSTVLLGATQKRYVDEAATIVQNKNL